MLNYITKYPGRITTPDANYPYGGAQNITTPGDGTGTPWDVDLINDILGFFQKMIAEASITPSGSSETVLASDIYDALDAFLTAIDDKYLPNNVEKLLTNDASAAPGEANIGAGYRDAQTYGRDTLGDLYFGLLGAGIQSYSQSVTGNIFFGLNSTSAIEIGSALGSAATKKLISGAKEATFEEIIDAATINSWITATLGASWTQVAGNEIKYRIYNNKLEIKGSARFVSGSLDLFTLPVGYRPVNDTYESVVHLAFTPPNFSQAAQIRNTGVVSVLDAYAANDYVAFNTIIPMD